MPTFPVVTLIEHAFHSESKFEQKIVKEKEAKLKNDERYLFDTVFRRNHRRTTNKVLRERIYGRYGYVSGYSPR